MILHLEETFTPFLVVFGLFDSILAGDDCIVH